MGEGASGRGLPLALALGWLVLWTVCALSPVSREVWWAENIPVMAIFAILAATWRLFRFTNLSYCLMAVFLALHTIGGHYTFAQVPFGWVTDLFGFERNHYDRLAHFSVGLYAYAIAELFERRGWAVRGAAMFAALASIMAVAGGYEIIEWWFAALAGGNQAGPAFLGSQGDIWDAQKDMLADTLGALAALIVYWRVNRGRRGPCLASAA